MLASVAIRRSLRWNVFAGGGSGWVNRAIPKPRNSSKVNYLNTQKRTGYFCLLPLGAHATRSAGEACFLEAEERLCNVVYLSTGGHVWFIEARPSALRHGCCWALS